MESIYIIGEQSMYVCKRKKNKHRKKIDTEKYKHIKKKASIDKIKQARTEIISKEKYKKSEKE